MAFIVRVTGPEFLTEDGRKAFARIEESIRQYSAHTRESVYLVRRPLPLKYDHFVVLWMRGVAVVGLFPFSGTIRGGKRGKWTAEQPSDHSANHFSFDNPYEILTSARREIASTIHQPASGTAAIVESSTVASAESFDHIFLDLQTIALFTQPVWELHVEDALTDKRFSAMTVEHAVFRTIVHMPNLLRTIDRQSGIYSDADLQAFADTIEQSAALSETVEISEIEEQTPVLQRARRVSKAYHKHHREWWASLIIVAGVLVYYLLRSGGGSLEQHKPDTTATITTVLHKPSLLVIKLPSDVQLFVSPEVYRTRSELDQALTHGEGQRYLPSTEHAIVLDSLVFAKGVYGYFKVDNAWRAGKLLQTFHAKDTIQIDNFLPPLP